MNDARLHLSVIGCGYLGAVHAAAMASLGHVVIGIDTDEAKIAALSAGRAPFFEPGLDALLAEQVAQGRLRFTTDIAESRSAQIHFLAVGTPSSKDGESADLSHLDAAVAALLPYLKPGDLVVGKSTVPAGTAARIADRIAAAEPEALLAWNPEFLREGRAVTDTVRPDRLVYGVPESDDGTAERILDAVYAASLATGTPKVVADYATAELVKAAANAFLATKISFINAMAEIAETVGADVTLLAEALGHDERIGHRFLGAGIGFGGGCLPKDIRAFVAHAEDIGVGDSVAFLRTVDEINLRRRRRVLDLALEAFDGSVADRRITLLGVTFKPDSDDVRDSPALDVANMLAHRGAVVTVSDPEGLDNARARHPQLRYEPVTDRALHGAELVILVTEWREYRQLDPARTAELVATRMIIDGRNVLDPAAWRSGGWRYWGMGRP